MATRKRRSNRDHARKLQRPSVSNEVIEADLMALLTPAIDAQKSYYRQLGLRNRILTLPLMMAAVLTLLWRQVPSVQELTRLLAREDLLWCKATQVSQAALSQRFLEFPATVFERVFFALLPRLQQRWRERHQRPLPESITYARERFEHLWIADGSTLEALFRKLGSLQELERAPLAGKIVTVIDLVTRLPVYIWFGDNPKASDTRFEPQLLHVIAPQTLLILDRGFYHFQFFAQVIAAQADFITRLKAKAHYEIQQVFTETNSCKDYLIRLGTKRQQTPQLTLRLIQVRFDQTGYHYLTSVTDPQQLPPFVVADLYRRRWRIEEAFSTVKRLLGLSYLLDRFPQRHPTSNLGYLALLCRSGRPRRCCR